jgi:hypothetical protein
VALTRSCLAFFVTVLLLADARAAHAQVFRDSTPKARIEGRLDALIGDRTAIEPGAGIFVPLGTYVRAGIVGGVGPITNPLRITGRAEVIGRFLLDPLYEHHWGPYIAAGLGEGSIGVAPHPYLLALLGVEGPRWGPVTPALEAGVGNGVRVGFALRRSQVKGWR